MAINEALAEYLALYHKGEANAVTSRELECSFQMRGSELRREINALRGDGIPVCSFEGGYYYAATAEELERTIRQLRSRIKKIAFAERGLSSALSDYGTGLVVACFECGIEYTSGRGNIRETALNAIKGFMAVSLFTVVPVRLYELSVTLQGQLTAGITGYGASIGDVASDIMQEFSAVESLTDLTSGPFLGFGSITSGIMILFCIILMAYAIIKVFFSNLKRGGILLIQIAVGSLYMFSVPRGYTDGFIQWCKQIIGLCLTAFLQATILIAGLMVFKDHALLGLGLMLSAGEIPRIAGAFGLDTTTRANIMSAVYTAQAAVNTTRTIVQAVSK